MDPVERRQRIRVFLIAAFRLRISGEFRRVGLPPRRLHRVMVPRQRTIQPPDLLGRRSAIGHRIG